jgi:hypothetical protein
MKKTLWAFGDSHTAGHGCTPWFEYYKQWYKEGDGIWTEHLANTLNLNPINRGRGGSSNDMILDKIIDSFSEIKKGDVVIIGKTYSHRFDVPHIYTKELLAVFWDWEEHAPNELISQFTKEEKEIIINFQYGFMLSPLFDERWDKRYEWIKGLLEAKGCKCIVWDVLKELKGMETIHKGTKGKIVDYHMSFKGHKDFSIHMWNKWFKDKTML